MATYECECGGGHHRHAAEPERPTAPELREYAAETGLLGGEYDSPLTEAEESALATELLGVADEQELEAFLGSLLAPLARHDGGFLSAAAGEALGGVLKNVARTVLPPAPPTGGRGVSSPPCLPPTGRRGAPGPGCLVVDRLPMLRQHVGTRPDLILKWNAMDRPSRIDVVVHLHGFALHGGRMTLPVDMEPVSGLEFHTAGNAPGRTAPTLLVLPRGHHVDGPSGRRYSHPALEPPGAIDRLVAEALARFRAATGVDAPRGRLVLTAHSGGGASLVKILRTVDPDEVHTFDALYQDPTPLIDWARQRIDRGSGALRVLYRPYEKTARNSERVAAAVRPAGSPRFRVEWTKVQHMHIPRLYGPLLLADVAADLPGTGPAPAPRRGTAVREVADTYGELASGTGDRWSGTPEQLDFRQRVLSAHLAHSRQKGRPGRDLAPDELSHVPGTPDRIIMRSDAAAAAGRLLAAANAALAEARASGDADSGHTTRLTATSGYRGRERQRSLWLGHFTGYYDVTATARAKLPGGPHGDRAVRYMLVDFPIPDKIAAPGYSNHQNGIAIDFLQERDRGHGIANSTGKRAVRRWRSTWFYGWLRANAHRFGFGPLATEPWHWIFRGSPSTELFGLGSESMDPQESEFEVARRFVRLSAAAARNAAMAPRDRYHRYRPYRGRAGDRAVGRAAVFTAARRYAPGLYRSFHRYARPAPWYWPRRRYGHRYPGATPWPVPLPYEPTPEPMPYADTGTDPGPVDTGPVDTGPVDAGPVDTGPEAAPDAPAAPPPARAPAEPVAEPSAAPAPPDSGTWVRRGDRVMITEA
ncbi:M15 family metallopeptidase [Streptomyces nymphaeiformis]|uniref:D-alanyl-D-alanine carboxypeptidase-like core domain-containing protein n=1 Tax=Streptomyces nymphaeiformis TaxID=2663842 RepID=A0A7W7TW64_9ACTN|nr:M15 family metallopeptidase [Streptomyces nymphaeiformis]MBB4980489.1 hypothetical protein [Streptomyces nymphaeiformis]